MHRFVEVRAVDGGDETQFRLAVRADGALWLLGDAQRPMFVDRGSGWVAAARLCLCAGDRLRLGGRELAADELCHLAGFEVDQIRRGAAGESAVPEIAAPVPLMLRKAVVDNARRDPGTGQIAPHSKEKQ